MHLYGSSNAYVQYSAVVIDIFDLLMEFIVDCFCGSSLHIFFIFITKQFDGTFVFIRYFGNSVDRQMTSIETPDRGCSTIMFTMQPAYCLAASNGDWRCFVLKKAILSGYRH